MVRVLVRCPPVHKAQEGEYMHSMYSVWRVCVCAGGWCGDAQPSEL